MSNQQVNFDEEVERNGTQCEKYDGRQAKFGTQEVIPLWVADMDFAAAPGIQQALQARGRHPVFGYTFADDETMAAQMHWFLHRHNWKIDPQQLLLTPGVVPSLFAAVNALTEPGDGVIVITPVYPPFFSAVTSNGRQLLPSRLLLTKEGYRLDFDELEQLAKKARMLLFCNPHNPVGRVWQQEELAALVDLALRHDLVMVSDDIHCDLVYEGNRYTPLPILAPPELRLLTAISPSKAFNIPGLNLSGLVVSHQADLTAISRVFARAKVNPFNPFSLAAFKAAYQTGEAWLDQLLVYLDNNCLWVKDKISQLEGIEVTLPEATCLMWLDCRNLSLTDDNLADFFVHKAGLGLNTGISFGPGGSGFMRLNIGTQQAVLGQAMIQLKDALQAFQG